jgi:TRAP-type uncharacterized transport system fused permease subunit
MMLTWKYTLPAFLVPFVFTLSPDGAGVLLIGTPAAILQATLTAALGIAALAAGVSGWIVRPAGVPERAGLIACGLLLCYGAGWSDLLGLALAAVVSFLHFLGHTRATHAP